MTRENNSSPQSTGLPDIPLAVPDLRGKEDAYLLACVRENWISSVGPQIVEFENRIAQLCAVPHAVAVVNGTCALQLAIKATIETTFGDGAKERDLIVVPNWTFAATANAVVHAGFKPYFIDISLETWMLDPDALSDCLSRLGARVAAVVPVHAMGLVADMDRILKIAGAHGIPVVEDSAGAIGARRHGRPAGSIGAAGILSFNGNKTVTAGGGGMVLSADDRVADRVRLLSTQARGGDRYHHRDIGYNYRMTNLNAAVGLAQLERLPEMLAIKARIAGRYIDAASRHPMLDPQPTGDGHSWWMSAVAAPDADSARRLSAHMRDHGIDARVFWEALSAQPAYGAFGKDSTPIADGLSGRVIAVPCSTSLNDEDQDRVIAALEAWS